MEVDVGVYIEDEDEGEADSSYRGTMEVGVDAVARIDILDGVLMPDALERLEQVKEVVQDIYGHVMEIPLQRVEDIKTGQRELEARSLIAGRERAGLFDRVVAFEGKRETSRHLEDGEQLKNSLTNKALATYEANRVAELVVESQSQNGDYGDNKNSGGNGNGNGEGNGDENGGGNRNGNGGGNGNGNLNRNDRGDVPVAHECTYHDFVKCQPLNFKGTEGVVGLTRWFEKMEIVFHISNCPERYQVKYATCTLLNSALTWWNVHKRTVGADAAFAMSWRELMKLMTEMVPKEEDRVEKFIKDLPDNIQGNVIAVKPTRLQDVVCIANNLMDQKLKGCAVRNVENKRRLDNNQRDNCRQQLPVKRQNVGGQNVARAYTDTNNERRGYVGPLLYCNKCKLHHEGQCTERCSNCKKVRHMARDCKDVVATTTRGAPEPNQKVDGKQTNKARGKAYVLGGGEANPDSKVVMGTFLLNNRYASMLFYSGADRSFVSSTFSALLDAIPSTLNVRYAVELVDGRIAETNIMLRGYTLGFLGHLFNIDLMPIELGSFDVIIGMDWLANHHAVIVCDEKIIWIPYGDEVLIVQVTKKEIEDKSEEKRLEDVPIVQNFPEVFPEDLPGLPPT
ncbi:putative reverse transcriptase domain-containing protein [Tanacetum coccineum]